MSRLDHKHAALLVGTGNTVGHISDLEMQWLLLQPGVVAPVTTQDAWGTYWDTQLVPDGAHNDRASNWLSTLGHIQGDLPSQWDSYWKAGSILAARGSFIHPHLAVATVALMAWYDRAIFWFVDGVRGLFA